MRKIRKRITILVGVGLIVLLAFACTDNLDIYKPMVFTWKRCLFRSVSW